MHVLICYYLHTTHLQSSFLFGSTGADTAIKQDTTERHVWPDGRGKIK